MPLTLPCPCGSTAPYAACCGPLHDGAPAPTAEALMRSRYAAYVVGRPDHIFRTWHPRTRPADVGETGPRWTGLQVLRVVDGGLDDDAGVVEFEAGYDGGVLHETSRFVRRRGIWVYLDDRG